jgi:hypothetical protein
MPDRAPISVRDGDFCKDWVWSAAPTPMIVRHFKYNRMIAAKKVTAASISNPAIIFLFRVTLDALDVDPYLAARNGIEVIRGETRSKPAKGLRASI